MDPDLTCCFGRALRALGREEPLYEWAVTRTYHERSNETEFLVSWVGSEEETPEWLAHETYEVQPRWVRHYLAVRANGNIQGVAIFEAPEVKSLAMRYLNRRYKVGSSE